MNPKQYEKWVYGHWEEITGDAASACYEWAKTVIEQAIVATVEAIKVIRNTINEWTKRVYVAAGTSEAYEEKMEKELI